MPEVYSGVGVYQAYEEDDAHEGDEVSSTYEGRHLTFLGSDLIGPNALIQKGDPVVVHATGGIIVGVAFKTQVLTADLIAIDTEGIWLLEVTATDQDEDNEVVAGDALFIDTTDLSCVISKNNNKVTHTHFGYALGNIDAGSTAVIVVKVHATPNDALELVGQQGAALTSANADQRFREYHYQATGGGYPHGMHIELNILTTACISAQALVAKIRWTNATNLVGGYCAAGEFEIEVGGGAGAIDNMYCIHLTSHIGVLTGSTVTNVETGWIAIDEYAQEQGSQIEHLFRIADTDSDYPRTTDANCLFTTLAGDVNPNFALKFVMNGVDYWFLCRNAIT